ncbi:HNH/ENDO VII family nuclease [Clostridium sp. ZBS13]|uniref:HNH/ENDO VII family nuclease n=1 Tax=Clostridium sp. ZBS13 TaxID=2949971 RepID=UPI00207B06FF|nr:HNH/ENDO VII family nuclease [Clostridium sp. ZBS13]
MESLDGFSRIDNYSDNFRGLEVRAQRSLEHLSDKQLQFQYKEGLSPKDINGDTIILHHHEQNVAGPIIEIPRPNHKMGNIKQHPLGNSGGVGSGAEREAFNAWRVQYWKARYAEELIRRGVIK